MNYQHLFYQKSKFMDSQDANKKNILQLKANKIYDENFNFFYEKLTNSAQISRYQN
jgi:hypothetical protein